MPKYGDTYCSLNSDYKSFFEDRIGWKLHIDDVKNGNVYYTFMHVYPNEQLQRLTQEYSVVKKEVSLDKFTIELEKTKLTSNACTELDSKYQSEQNKIKSLVEKLQLEKKEKEKQQIESENLLFTKRMKDFPKKDEVICFRNKSSSSWMSDAFKILKVEEFILDEKNKKAEWVLIYGKVNENFSEIEAIKDTYYDRIEKDRFFYSSKSDKSQRHLPLHDADRKEIEDISIGKEKCLGIYKSTYTERKRFLAENGLKKGFFYCSKKISDPTVAKYNTEGFEVVNIERSSPQDMRVYNERYKIKKFKYDNEKNAFIEEEYNSLGNLDSTSDFSKDNFIEDRAKCLEYAKKAVSQEKKNLSF